MKALTKDQAILALEMVELLRTLPYNKESKSFVDILYGQHQSLLESMEGKPRVVEEGHILNIKGLFFRITINWDSHPQRTALEIISTGHIPPDAIFKGLEHRIEMGEQVLLNERLYKLCGVLHSLSCWLTPL